MFEKLTAAEPLNLLSETEAQLSHMGKEYVSFDSIPKNDDEIIARINSSDAVLLNVNTGLSEYVLRNCKNLKYIGLCCTLYEDESCSVHLPTARELGIKVTGVSDYGDNGVPEFIIYALTGFLHGFTGKMWLDSPSELTDVKVGVLGMGTTGTLAAKALKHFGADVTYFARHKKPHAEEIGIEYESLDDMLNSRSVICSCLNKNVVLLDDEALKKWSGNKILVNTSLSPSFSADGIRRWLDEGNHLFCDSYMSLGDKSLLDHPNVSCMGTFSGGSHQAIKRLGDGVIKNIESHFKSKEK